MPRLPRSWRAISSLGDIQLTGLDLVSLSPGSWRSWAVQGWWMPAASGWDGSDPLGLGIGHEVAVAHRAVADGELEDAVEDHAAAA